MPRVARSSRSLVVAGAGVFGLAAAVELAARGWDVTVLDPGPIPRTEAASTDISKIVRMDYGADELYVEMAEAALEGWDRWNAEWPRPLYHQDGFLLLASGPMTPGTFEGDSFGLLARRGHRLERLSPGVLAKRFPAWPAETYGDGYFNPRAGWAESGAVVARLADVARAAGVRVLAGRVVALTIERGGPVRGVVMSDGSDIPADVTLVAAGAWTPALLPHLEAVMWATAQPVLHFTIPDPAAWRPPRFPVWAADISRTGWYGFPSLDDGTIKIASHGPGRRVHPDERRTVPADEEPRFRAFLSDVLPAVAGAPLRASRLCLYCDTFDGNFWIDHDPDRPGLVVAAGGSGHGFKFAPILGGLIADVVEGVPNAWAPRFGWRRRDVDRREAARAREIT